MTPERDTVRQLELLADELLQALEHRVMLIEMSEEQIGRAPKGPRLQR